MPQLRNLLSLSLLLLLPLAAGPSAAHAQEEGEFVRTYTRSYSIRYLNIHEAEVLVWDQCPQSPRRRCAVGSAGPTEAGLAITVEADAATHERIARALAERDVVPKTQVFQVSLVLGSKGAGGGGGELPAAAAAALADVEKLLPFSRYQVVDSAWLRTTRAAEVFLSGPDGHPLRVTIRFDSRAGDQIFVNGFEIFRPAVIAGSGPEGGKTPPEPPRQLLGTSFSMRVGETLVVGTSKLDGGDEALLALVTAVE